MEGFSSTFRVDLVPSEVWARLLATQPADRKPDQWWIPGFEAPGAELDLRDGESVSVEKLTEPCVGTTITLTLAADEGGTTVTVTQSGFGDRWAIHELLAVGWAHIVADLALSLRHGLRGRRHLRPWSTLGAMFADGPAGPSVTAVFPDSAAERAGLERDDVIVAVQDSPIAMLGELEAVLRSHRGGTVEIEWARGGELYLTAAVL